MKIANSSQDLFTCDFQDSLQEVKKLNGRISGKEKTVKYLREKYEMNKISDQFSQKSKSKYFRIRNLNKF